MLSEDVPKPAGPKMKLGDRIRNDLKTDANLAQMKSLVDRSAKSLPSATVKYIVDKVPIIRWLPNYSPKWILNDLAAGTTIGLLLIPQSLAYAKIADIPEEYGLMSSWLPPLIYAFMGTSKDLCPGPTSIIGVLIAEIVKDFKSDGFAPQQIAGVVTFLVGLISLVIGTLKMGSILNFVSVPVLSGFVSAAGCLTILSQISVLFGYTTGSGTARKIYDAFAKLPDAEPFDTIVGLSSILILYLAEKAGKRWGSKFKVIWALSICRNAVLIMIFTLVSYFVNRNVETPYFAIAKTSETSIGMPNLPPTSLIRRLFTRSIAVFMALALEHLAIGKTFARKNGYQFDGSQELVFLGLSNLLNGFFPTIPGGGSFSRSAVNSDSGVKTPLSGIITSGFVLFSLYFLTGALYWIPKATLAAVIMIAVWSLLVGPSTFYRYWRISFPDFLASMIAFWVTLFVSIESGVMFAVIFNLVHVIFRMISSPMTTVDTQNWPKLYPNSSSLLSTETTEKLLSETVIFIFKRPIIFLNVERSKTDLLEAYKQRCPEISSNNTTPTPEEIRKLDDRLWCDKSNTSIDTVTLARSRASILHAPSNPPSVIILDFSHVFYIDVTGIQALSDARRELQAGTHGANLQWRIVGLRDSLRARLSRAGWNLQVVGAEDYDSSIFEEKGESAPIMVFQDIHHTILFGRSKSDNCI